MKNILFIITGLGYSKLSGIGGSDKRAVEIINNIDSTEYKTFIICPVNSKVILKGHLKKNINFIQINPSNIVNLGSENIFSRFYAYIEIIFLKKNITLNENFDLIYSSSDCISDVLLATYLSKKYKIKKCIMLHHRIPNPISRKGNFFINLISYLLQKITNRIIKNNFKNIIFYKTFEGEQFSKYFKDNNKFFVNNGIDTNLIINEIQNHKNDVIFVGGLRFSKGIDDLVQIGKFIKARNKSIRINVYGSGSKENISYINKQIINYNLQKILLLHGSKNKDQIKNIMGNSKILILPSYEEGWSIVIYEALYFGCQVVTYDLPSFFHLNDYIHLVNNFQEMFEKIDAILEDKSLMKPKPSDNFFNEISWSKVASDEKLIFDKILS